ncbi:hypothetical protein HYX13_01705 [Candidatus Woesearchaeota archaeon]|nr:hypothetical protein [Candidatus Woesearchaeota archaeon]
MADWKNDQKENKEKEIVIRLRPRSVLKSVLLVLLLVSTFYLGRFSVEPPTFDVSLSGAVSAEKKTADVPAVEVKTAQVEQKVKEPLAAPTAAAVVDSGTESTDAADSDSSAPVDVGPVITTYTGKAALAIESVKTAWKETYGKITDIEYTLKNNEAGTVKPAYFYLMVEGYDDYEKKVPLPVSKQSIAAGEIQKYLAKVPNGFAYNKATVPDLSNVLITLVLYDESGKQITTATKRVALEWKESSS